MGAKLHICLSGRLSIRGHVNVDPQRVQRREELQAEKKDADRQMRSVLSEAAQVNTFINGINSLG